MILLEVTLAGMDGLEVLRRLREDRIEEPVLFLTAQTALQDKVTGLTAGAEDYITKPFNAKEVSARIRVILRRSTSTLAENPLSGRLTVADLELDLNTGHAWRHGEPIALSPTEFTLLHYFMSNPGKALSKTIIMEERLAHPRRGRSQRRGNVRLLPAPQDRHRRHPAATPCPEWDTSSGHRASFPNGSPTPRREPGHDRGASNAS